MNSKRLNALDKISVLLLFLGILPSVFRMIRLFVPEVVLTNGCFFMWLILILLFDEKNRKMMLKIKTIFPVILLLIIYILASLFGNEVFGNRYMGLSLIFFAPTIFTYYKNNNKLSVIKYISIMLLPFIMFTWIKTFIALLTNPFVARSIKSEGEYSASLTRRGIGGYHLIYFVMALAPVLLYVFLYNKNIKMRITALALYIFAFVTVVVSNYFTALMGIFLASVVMVIMYFIKNKNIFMTIMFLMASVIILIMFNDIYSWGISFLSGLSGDGKTAERLSSMENSFGGGLIGELKADRWPTMQKSLLTFFNNPIIGVSPKDFRVFNPLKDVGQHSYVCDTLAIWGLLVGVPILKLTFKPFTKERFKGRLSVLSVSMLITIIVVYGFNNSVNSVSGVLYLLYPYLCEVYKE